MRNLRIWHDEDIEIIVMNADGSGQTRLTNKGRNVCPTWSPDGTKIAFSSSIDGNEEIYTMNADGSEQIKLTNREAEFSSPVWSPDARNLTKLTDRGGFSIHPAWSP